MEAGLQTRLVPTVRKIRAVLLPAASNQATPSLKGVMVLVTRRSGDDPSTSLGAGPSTSLGAGFTARALTFVAIYSGIGLRDDGLNEQLGRALMRTPFPRLTRLRRDAHAAEQTCWLHGADFCLSS